MLSLHLADGGAFLELSLQNLDVAFVVGEPLGFLQQVSIGTEDDGAGKSLDFKNLGHLGIAIEVQMDRNEISLDRRHQTFVGQSLTLQLVSEVTPTGTEDDQHRLISFRRQLMS